MVIALGDEDLDESFIITPQHMHKERLAEH